MKLATLASALVLITLFSESAASAAESSSAPSVARADVTATARNFSKIYSSDGMYGVISESQNCYRQFSQQPSWKILDRCMTLDYIARDFDQRYIEAIGGSFEVTAAYFRAEPSHLRWARGAKRLGGSPDLLASHVERIMQLIPWKEVMPQRDLRQHRRD